MTDLASVPTRRARPRRAALLVATLVALATLAVAPRPASALPIIPLVKPITVMARGVADAKSIVVGPDGNLWFTSERNDSIGRVTPTGVVAMFGSTAIDAPHGIAAGPDGNLWFTSNGNDRIGRITPTGVISTFTSALVHEPWGITKGHDGALWFTQRNNSIGRITTAGAITTLTADVGVIDQPDQIVTGDNSDLWFTNSGVNDSIGHVVGSSVLKVTSAKIKSPTGITVGPDDNIWFTNIGDESIGKLVPGTGDVTTYPATGMVDPMAITPGPNSTLWVTATGNSTIAEVSTLGTVTLRSNSFVGSEYPWSIVQGPDGNLWYANDRFIGRINTFGQVSRFGTGAENADGITTGPDGNLWATSDADVVRITPAGARTKFGHPDVGQPGGITTGPDGNLWFTDRTKHHIGRITPTGTFTLFTDPGLKDPRQIVKGPDGNLWFTDEDDLSVGRVTPSGVITRFHDPSILDPGDLVAGPDGNIWFTNSAGPSIGRITPAGSVTSYPTAPGHYPSRITVGADGNLWYTATTAVEKITTAGVITPVVTDGVDHPGDIVLGADGNVWFSNQNDKVFGKVTRNGSVTYVTRPNGIGAVVTMTAGPDGNAWFTTGDSVIGRLTVAPQRFSDVPVGSAFYADINWIVTTGIASGYPDGTFKPTAVVTRQAMAAFLYRFAGSPLGATPPCPAGPFNDVPQGAPFCGEITWLANEGIAGGYPDGGFHPAASVSRQAMAAFLYRLAAGGKAPACTKDPFEDVAQGSTFCGEITWAANAGVITGYSDGTFQPAHPVTRQAMAAFLHRLDDYLGP